MKAIESKEVGKFAYTRYVVNSSALGQDAKFGIFVPKSLLTPAEKTVYFFHGGDGDDTQLAGAGLLEQLTPELCEKFSRDKIQLVAPFLGTNFIGDGTRDVPNNYVKFLEEELFHLIDSMQTAKASLRYLVGASIGGYAALRLFLKSPREYLGVAALAPAVFDFDESGDKMVEDYISLTGANQAFMAYIIGLLRTAFPTDEQLRSANLLRLAESVPHDRLRGKSIYLSVGSLDEFGLAEGVAKLSSIFKERDIFHKFNTVDGSRHNMDFARTDFSRAMSELLTLG